MASLGTSCLFLDPHSKGKHTLSATFWPFSGLSPPLPLALEASPGRFSTFYGLCLPLPLAPEASPGTFLQVPTTPHVTSRVMLHH